jgi:1-acyl-sn-glycerol-3-phosphate acyltransferase
MRPSPRYIWALFAAALAFACFGIGGVLLGLFGFPLLALCIRDPRQRQLWARRVVQRTFAVFIALMRGMGLLSYEIHGLERLNRRGLLILANHPSLIDIVFLGALVKNSDCVVRSGLANNIFTRGPIRAAGYIRNDGGAELLGACIASLRNGSNLIIFPEGTRTRPGQPMKMQRGAAQIAVRMPCDVTPVAITCVPAGLNKGSPWWHAAKHRLHFSIHVGEDIAVMPFIRGAPDEPGLAARQLTAYLVDYFSRYRAGSHAGTRNGNQKVADRRVES